MWKAESAAGSLTLPGFCFLLCVRCLFAPCLIPKRNGDCVYFKTASYSLNSNKRKQKKIVVNEVDQAFSFVESSCWCFIPDPLWENMPVRRPLTGAGGAQAGAVSELNLGICKRGQA